MEEWKPIKGFEDYYRISDYGNIFSIRSGRNLKLSTNSHGYLCATLRVNGSSKQVKVHRLVAIHFLDKSNDYDIVNHKDGNKQNNYKDNLEWSTYSNNNQHAYDLGLKDLKSESFSKLTREEVEYIRSVYVPGHIEFSATKLALKFGVHRTTISKIVNNKRWIK